MQHDQFLERRGFRFQNGVEIIMSGGTRRSASHLELPRQPGTGLRATEKVHAETPWETRRILAPGVMCSFIRCASRHKRADRHDSSSADPSSFTRPARSVTNHS
ncbi:predicted protein [Coccidioides posadasii str. Silveira]|uniref:Predicted protein n=1 Tax=Coccidioides posadasii (strain RMSCC 757 / Silveira) TaxID=443226 RepID=E9CY46_COCPS|nr:predicted protein [Coccidioides posadasii str. Silveira]